jgi:hypothetical protein
VLEGFQLAIFLDKEKNGGYMFLFKLFLDIECIVPLFHCSGIPIVSEANELAFIRIKTL